MTSGVEEVSVSTLEGLQLDGGPPMLLSFNQVPTDPAASLDNDLANSPSAMVLLGAGETPSGAAESTTTYAPPVAMQGMLLSPGGYGTSVASDLHTHNASVSRYGGHSPHAHLITTSLLRSSAPEVVSHTAEARRVSTKPSERIGHRNGNGKRNSRQGNRKQSGGSPPTATAGEDQPSIDGTDSPVGSQTESPDMTQMQQVEAIKQQDQEQEKVETAKVKEEETCVEEEGEDEEEEDEESEDGENDEDDGDAEAMVIIQPLQQLVLDEEEAPLPAPTLGVPEHNRASVPSSPITNSGPQEELEGSPPAATEQEQASSTCPLTSEGDNATTTQHAAGEEEVEVGSKEGMLQEEPPHVEPMNENLECKPPAAKPEPPLEFLVFGPQDALAIARNSSADAQEHAPSMEDDESPTAIQLLEPQSYEPWTPSPSPANVDASQAPSQKVGINESDPILASTTTPPENVVVKRTNDCYHDEGRVTLTKNLIILAPATATKTSDPQLLFRTFGLGLGSDPGKHFWETLGSDGAASERRRLRLMERREHIQHREADVRRTLIATGEAEVSRLRDALTADLDNWFRFRHQVNELVQEEETLRAALSQKLCDRLERWNTQFREVLVQMWKSFQQQQLLAEERAARLALVEEEAPLRDELFELEIQCSTAILIGAQKLVTRRAKAKWKQMEFERKMRMGHVEQFAEIRKSWREAPEAYGHRSLRLVEPPPDAPPPMIHQRGIYPSRLFRSSSPRNLNRRAGTSLESLSYYARLSPLALSSSLPMFPVEEIQKTDVTKSPRVQRGSPLLPIGKDPSAAAGSGSDSNWTQQQSSFKLPLISGWRWDRRSKSEAQLREEVRQELERQRKHACSSLVIHRGEKERTNPKGQ